MGCDIVTGGGPGLMQAANEGAASVDPQALQRSVGIRVDLPFEQTINPFVGQAYEHRTFFSRLHHFMIVSDAFVVVPGGVGTLLEMSLVWQLLQVRKLYATPLILVGKMWAELIEWGRRSMLQEGSELASAVDFGIPHCVNDVAETVALIRTHRDEWLRAQAALADDARTLKLPDHKTKIVATIGPASDSPEMLERLMRAGTGRRAAELLARRLRGHAESIARIRAAARATGRRVAIMADLPGPKMRLGRIEPEPIELRAGDAFTLTTEDVVGDARRVSMSFERLPQVVKPGDRLFLNDGLVQLAGRARRGRRRRTARSPWAASCARARA